jgi:hypothetical protein
MMVALEGEAPSAEVVPDLRCPCCDDALVVGALTARCDACDTAHHASCFAERRACGARGCRGKRATARPLSTDGAPTCAVCEGALPGAAFAARCGCKRLSHVDCFEARRGCGSPRCRGRARVGPRKALEVERDRRRVLRALVGLCLLSLSVALVSLSLVARVWP